jgi:hypothetical protein
LQHLHTKITKIKTEAYITLGLEREESFLPDWVPDEPEGVGDGDLLAGIQQLLLFQVKVLQQAGHHIFYIVGPSKKFISADYPLKTFTTCLPHFITGKIRR